MLTQSTIRYLLVFLFVTDLTSVYYRASLARVAVITNNIFPHSGLRLRIGKIISDIANLSNSLFYSCKHHKLLIALTISYSVSAHPIAP